MPPTYRYPQVPLTRFLDDAARDFPEVTAVEAGPLRWTYDELRATSDDIAAGLAVHGVAPGDRVGVALPNCPSAVAVPFALWRLGAVLVPIEPWLPSEEIVRILEDAGAMGLIASAPVIEQLRRDGVSRTTRLTVSVEDEGWLPDRRRLFRRRRRADRAAIPGAHRLQDLADQGAPVRQAPVTADTLAVIAYTGGTTGVRRGVMLTHGNLVANAFQARLWVPDIQAGRERVLAANPFNHVYGLTMGLLATVLSAGSLLLVAEVEPAELVAAIESGRPTLFPAVPSLLRSIVEAPKVHKHDLTSLRACVSGGSRLPGEVAQKLRELTGGCRVREGYGLTEAGPLTHANPIYGRSHDDCIGLPVTDTIALVLDPTSGEPVPPGEVGEMAVAGPQIMAGYWKDQKATAMVRRGPWLLTGDLVRCDDDGFFTFVDRKQDMVIVADTPVFPRTVEHVLRGHRQVSDVAVIGTIDAQHGPGLEAYVVPRTRRRIDPDELIEYCREQLEEVEVPRAIHLVSELPINRMGKVLRRQLGAAV